MDKKPFDFKDLMAFGMFILALLTFVSANLKQCSKYSKTALVLWRVRAVLKLILRGNHFVAVAPFYVFNIAYLTEARKCTDTLINVNQITADSEKEKEE